MTRTPVRERILPRYTRGEEIFNMVSHIVGGALGVSALALAVVFAAVSGDAWDVVGASVYGASLVVLYTMSSVYHGLAAGTGKKVLQVLDHCTIYFLIAGTYTPILLSAIRPIDPVLAWTVFGAEWGIAALAVTLTAIDLKKYSVFSMICYIGMGWFIIFAAKKTIEAMSLAGFLWILAGGISYTLGAIFYGFGRKVKYMHAVFHLFVVLGSVLQFFGILFYAIL